MIFFIRISVLIVDDKGVDLDFFLFDGFRDLSIDEVYCFSFLLMLTFWFLWEGGSSNLESKVNKIWSRIVLKEFFILFILFLIFFNVFLLFKQVLILVK